MDRYARARSDCSFTQTSGQHGSSLVDVDIVFELNTSLETVNLSDHLENLRMSQRHERHPIYFESSYGRRIMHSPAKGHVPKSNGRPRGNLTLDQEEMLRDVGVEHARKKENVRPPRNPPHHPSWSSLQMIQDTNEIMSMFDKTVAAGEDGCVVESSSSASYTTFRSLRQSENKGMFNNMKSKMLDCVKPSNQTCSPTQRISKGIFYSSDFNDEVTKTKNLSALARGHSENIANQSPDALRSPGVKVSKNGWAYPSSFDMDDVSSCWPDTYSELEKERIQERRAKKGLLASYFLRDSKSDVYEPTKEGATPLHTNKTFQWESPSFLSCMNNRDEVLEAHTIDGHIGVLDKFFRQSATCSGYVPEGGNARGA